VAIKTFRARSVGEALAMVKREMGGDAVILHTRTVRSGGVLGLGGRHVTEITATDQTPNARGGRAQTNHPIDDTSADTRDASVPRTPRDSERDRRPALTDDRARERLLALARSRGIGGADASDVYRQTRAPNRPVELDESESPDYRAEAARSHDTYAPTQRRSRQPANESRDHRTRSPHHADVREPREDDRRQAGWSSPADDDTELAEQLAAARRLARHAIDGGDGSPPAAPRRKNAETSSDRATMPSPERRSEHSTVRSGDSQGQHANDRHTAAPVSPSSADDAPAPNDGHTGERPTDPALRAELESLHSLVRQLMRSQQSSTAGAMPNALARMYHTMVSQEIGEELADRMLGSVRDDLTADEQDDPERVRRATVVGLARRLPTMRSLPKGGKQDDGRPLTLALLGPTGVGKTTTVAKIAAAYKLRFGHRVGLITCDTYRIAAVDQLRQYANIIGLPVEVAITPADVEHACHQLRDCDVIIIDTAGRSQRDAGKLGELTALLDAAQPHQRHLVLSGAASSRVLHQAADRFAAASPDHVVFTKLDEAVGLGPLVGVVDRLGTPVSFVTTGQEVPDEIELARGERLAEGMLNGGWA
jgi:flagellar biosynthesis protein FlhF